MPASAHAPNSSVTPYPPPPLCAVSTDGRRGHDTTTRPYEFCEVTVVQSNVLDHDCKLDQNPDGTWTLIADARDETGAWTMCAARCP